MADDIERHLASQPIEARPPSALYQMRKFTARNRAFVTGSIAALLTLIAFAATTTIQSGRIRAEAERAARAAEAERQVSDFMIGLFDRSDPTLSHGEDLTAREILDAEAEPLYRRSIEIEEAVGGRDNHNLATSLHTLAIVYQDQDRFEATDDTSEKPAAYEVAGELSAAQEHYDDAVARYLKAIALVEEDSPGSAWVGHSMTGLARVYRDSGRIDDAVETYRRALDLMRRDWGDDDPDVRRAEQELTAMETPSASD